MSEISLNLDGAFDADRTDNDTNKDKISPIGIKSQAVLTILSSPFGMSDFRAGNVGRGLCKLTATVCTGGGLIPIIDLFSIYRLAIGQYQDSDGKFIRSAVKIKRDEISSKDHEVTLIFSICLGWFGVHQFYAGKPLKGLAMLCTFGGLGLWNVYDIYQLATVQFKDGQGKVICPNYLKAAD